MSTEKRNGPKLKIVASCTGCAYEHSEYYCVEDGNDVDSGQVVYCQHPAAVASAPKVSANGHRRIGDTTWATPEWCPLLAAAVGEWSAILTKATS